MTVGTARAEVRATAATVPAAPRSSRRVTILTLLSILLVVLVVVAAGSGAYRLAPAEVIGAVLDRVGIGWLAVPDEVGQAVLFEVRFPRVVLALLVGGSLGAAGALMQGVFANPLAEPGIVGVSAGAAVGAAGAIVLGWAGAAGTWSITVAAFVAGLLTTLLVYGASRRQGRTEVVTLVLTGIAVNALAGAIIGLLTFLSDDAQLRTLTFWNLGSVGSATWPAVAAVAPFAVLGLLVAAGSARPLDLLALGEGPARHLGVDVERVRRRLIVVVALLTAAAVAVAGVISFVGLVVPHLLRLLIGPGHRALLWGSALGGAAILVAADLVARTVAAPAEVPLGVLTALLGAPFFLWLLRRTRARQGGWG